MIAALFVDKNGPYANLPLIFDVWDEVRDARKYNGPHRVIAHPPCERWGRFSNGGFNNKYPHLVTGDDKGCFESALNSLIQFGGVLEHPAYSKAWPRFGLPAPVELGKWTEPDSNGLVSAMVCQSDYGHKCMKKTWLLGKDIDTRIVLSSRGLPGTHTIFLDRERKDRGLLELPKKERHLTPVPFRDLLRALVS